MGLYKQVLNKRTGQFNLVPTATAITFRERVASQANLPLTGNVISDGRIVDDTNHLYVWDLDASSGDISHWVDQGDIIDLTWAAISGKPNSSITDIDDAVSKKHAASGQFNQASAAEVSGLTDKATPVDADVVLIEDSATTPTAFLKKKLSWSNIKSVLKTYFDTLYQPLKTILTTLGNLANASGWLKNDGSGNLSYSTPSKSDVGLGNVDNKSEATIITNVKADSDVASAISLKHEQNHDTKLDEDGENEVTALNAKDAVNKKHTQNSDTKLADGTSDEVSAAELKTLTGDAIRKKPLFTPGNLAAFTDDGDLEDTGNSTSDFEPADPNIQDAVSLRHNQGTDQGLDTGGANAVTAAQAKAGYTHSGVTTGNPHQVTKSDVGLGSVTNDAQVKASQLKRGTFVNGDLSTGKLTITHSLGLAAPYSVIVAIFDNNGKQIIPDNVTGATNSVEIDLTSFGTLSGTWGYLLLG